MNNSLISVVIPSYNHENFIDNAILSVAFQDYQNKELIIIDDCSTDDSYKKILESKKKYGEYFNGGFFVSQNKKNLGAHTTLNKCIFSAKGNYIAILNADDMFLPERLKVILDCLKNYRFVFTSVRCVDELGLPIVQGNEHFEDAQHFETLGNIDALHFGQRIMGENIAVSTGNMFFEKKLFLQLRGFRNYKYVHDYDFLMRASLITEPLQVKHTAYLYRLHQNNSSSFLAKEGLRENRVLWLEYYNKIRTGKLTNEKILADVNYKANFYESVKKLGKKKETLWKLSKNPLVMMCVNVYKKIMKMG